MDTGSERIKEIFAQALQRESVAEWEQYLVEACQDSPELRQRWTHCFAPMSKRESAQPRMRVRRFLKLREDCTSLRVCPRSASSAFRCFQIVYISATTEGC